MLWLRMLALVFGVTAYAASTVLASFMGGLAVGSLLAGRVATRLTRPLTAFAVAELLIATTVLASPWLIERLRGAYTYLLPGVSDSFGTLTFVRFVCAFAVLLIPTTMMGATLPLVVASPTVRRGRVAARIGAIYATNTAGAIAGAVLTGFVLIGSVGIRASFLIAAAANVIAALCAFALSRRFDVVPIAGSSREAARPSTPQLELLRGRSLTQGVKIQGSQVSDAGRGRSWAGGPLDTGPTLSQRARRTVLLVFGLSGLAALALEVIWFRVLVLFVPATTYAFTAMLVAVLAGIAVGSWLATFWLSRERDWLMVLTRTQFATAVAAVGSLAALAWTYGAGWRTGGEPQSAGVAIFPVAVLMGFAFPIGIRTWARTSPGPSGVADREAARDVGTLYAVNVGGAIAGSLLAGFMLLPALGSRTSLIACAGIYLLCGLLLALHHPRRARAGLLTAAACLAFAVVASAVPDPFLATLQRRYGGQERIFWREEGIQTTVSVHVQPFGRHVLYLDGLHQANDSPEMIRVHRQIGHLPMVLHPNPGKVLVIGLGGGATAGAVARHPGVQVDVVELSDSVRKGAGLFAHVNDQVLTQPNVHLRVDDGRNFLQGSKAKYDVITADIIQPIHAGAGLLYSVEYFRLARAALADGGLMLQWIGHRPDTQYKLILRSFLDAFPETTLWAGGTLLVGSTRPLTLSRTAVERRLADPVARSALATIGLDSFETLASWYTAGPTALRRSAGNGERLTDDRPRIEFHRSLPDEREIVDLSALGQDRSELKIGG